MNTDGHQPLLPPHHTMSIYAPRSYDGAQQRILLVILRQSTLKQKRENLGSGTLQLEDLIGLGLLLGWPPERIEVMDLRGESGSRGERRLFRKILKRVRSGRVGGVAFIRNDRLGRTALESEELLRAAAEHHALIITEGRIYNPAIASDKLILGLFNQFAEYENNARTMWMMATRFALAKTGAYRVVLPTGLIAANPGDEVFLRKLKDAGLVHWLDDLDAHKAVSTWKGAKHYVLPYPDREVFEACRMRMERLLATGDLDAVVDMIRNDPDYPRPNHIPVTKALRRYHQDIEVRWVAVDPRDVRARLRKWFASPALYGIYQFRSPGLAARSPDEPEERFRVTIPNAFPAFAKPADRKRVRALVEADKKPWRRGSYKGPRRHLLDVMRCGRTDEDGVRCGHSMSAWYQPDGTYGYYSHACRFEGHKTQHVYGPRIDALLEETLLSVLERSRLEASLRRLRTNEGAATQRLRGFENSLKATEREIQGLTKAIAQAELDEAGDRKHVLNKELDGAIRTRRDLEEQVDRAQADVRQFRDLVAADRQQILSLGADVEALLTLAKERNPKLLRMLTAELVDTVYFDRLSGFVCRVELVFPGGAVVERTFMTRPMSAPLAALEWAAGKLAAGQTPERIAKALNKAPPKNHTVAWDEDRVITAPHCLALQEQPALRDGPARSIPELAKELEVGKNAVFVAAVAGDLGPGHYEDGQLWLRPTLEEIHRWIPGAARRYVAQMMGWPVEETIPRTEATDLVGLSRGGTVKRARRASGLGKDATGRHWVLRSDFAKE